MKWARVKEMSQGTNSKETKQDKKDDVICFDDFPDIDTLKCELEKKENQWEHYKFEHRFPEPVKEEYEKFQKRYEIFCGGYLWFYDYVVIGQSKDHTLHFKWSPEKGSGKYSVTIFLSPAPLPAIENYTKRCGKSPNEKEHHENYAEKLSTPQDIAAGKGGVDPPPPPPPPPPTMH